MCNQIQSSQARNMRSTKFAILWLGVCKTFMKFPVMTETCSKVREQKFRFDQKIFLDFLQKQKLLFNSSLQTDLKSPRNLHSCQLWNVIFSSLAFELTCTVCTIDSVDLVHISLGISSCCYLRMVRCAHKRGSRDKMR